MINHHTNSSTRLMLLMGLLVLTIILLACGGKGTAHPLSTPTPTHKATSEVTCDDFEVKGKVICVEGSTGHQVIESKIYPGAKADYHDSAWWVDGVKVEGVYCPTEDSCFPMHHDTGWMIHMMTP